MSTPGISVVIPNYNGESLLPFTLPTVIQALQTIQLPTEIIVVDDCSTDQSVTWLQSNYPSIQLLQNDHNSGFSITSNKGMRAAAYPWVLLLNSDVKLSPGYFQNLLKYCDRDQVFAVMGRILGWEDDVIQDGAKYPVFEGVKIKTAGNYLLKEESAMKDGIYSMYVSGANAFIHKERFLLIGGFNEIFSPFYVEDYELSLRAWRLGYDCYYEHFAICRHRTSSTIASSRQKNEVRKIYNRNKMLLHAIHLDPPQRSAWFLQLLGETIGQAVLFHGYFLKAVGLFIRKYPGVRASRRALKKQAGASGCLSVQQVAQRIKDGIGQRAITRF